MKTNVYIDGFNFYYACYRNWEDPECHVLFSSGPNKWLNFAELSARSFPSDTIHRIHYCTAQVKGSLRDRDKSVRQQTYLRALDSLPRFKVHLGHFEPRQKTGRLLTQVACSQQPSCVPYLVDVSVREEKGSDVNLATMLLKDAFLGDCEKAVVISNDSDLAGAIRVARFDAKCHVHVMSPYPDIVNELKRAATTYSILDKALIPLCQFPETLTIKGGKVLRKPKTW